MSPSVGSGKAPVARNLALRALAQFERRGGKPSEIVAALVRRAPAAATEQPFLMAIVYGVIRHRRWLDHVVNRYLDRPGRLSVEVRTILRMGALQLLYLDRVPDRAAVHTAVELAARRAGRPMASLVNAVLRRMQADRQGGLDDVGIPSPIRHSFPDWMVERWRHQLGDRETGELLAALNEHPPLCLRTNILRADRGGVAGRLAAEGLPTSPCRYSPVGLVAGRETPLETLASFGEGLFSVQDEAFQVIGGLLPVSPGRILLDAFAGLGGKSTHLAQRSKDRALILAADAARPKLARLAPECRRLRLSSVLPLAADARRLPFPDSSIDAILLDVPCSGTGIIRRHPDIKWNRVEADVPRLAAAQLAYLKAAAPVVKQGGWLVYATCSLEREENEAVIGQFLAENDAFRLEDPRQHGAPEELVTPEGFFRSYPHRHGIDGAGAALLRRER